MTPKSKSNAKYNFGYICSIPQAANSFNSTPPDDKLQSSGANSFKLFQPHLMGNCRAQVQIRILSFYSHLDIIHHLYPALILISSLILTYRKSAGLKNEVQEVGVNNAARAAHDPPHVDHQVHINVDDPSLELPEQVAWSWAGVGQREEPRLQHQDHHRPPSLEGEWQEWAGADSWDFCWK